MPNNNYQAEVTIIGRGPVALTAAIALASAGIETILIGQPAPIDDHRTTALVHSSAQALKTLCVWELCADKAAPLRLMRIVDDTGRLFRAPEASFRSSEIGLDCFGYNVENKWLLDALERRAGALGALTMIDGQVRALETIEAAATAHLSSGVSVKARLAVGADGRNSVCRAAAGITFERRLYPQAALTLNVAHARPHFDSSTEFHTSAGPFTLVPLPGRRSSIVFTMALKDIPRLTSLADSELADEIEQRCHSILGKINVEPGRGIYPLSIETVTSFGAARVVLAGEAAHVFPPIGAQGLNLGLRDAATVAELIVDARRRNEDIGSSAVTERYDRMRRADIVYRTMAVDLLNRSLLSDFLPWQMIRGVGLLLTSRISSLRQAVMREGITPAVSQPQLMRGELL